MQIASNQLNMKKHPEEQKKFYDKISKVLQKIGSSNKTKVLHKMVQEEMLYLGYGTTNITKEDTTRYGLFYLTGNKCSGLLADIKYLVSSSEVGSVETSIKKVSDIVKEISRVKTTITDTSAIQLKTLEKELKSEYSNIMDSIDYFNLVDIYYDSYIRMLFKVAQKGKGKNKVFEAAHNVFSEIAKGILKKNNFQGESETNKKVDIIIDFVFASLFTESSTSSITGSLVRMYGKEDVQFLMDLKPSSKGSLNGMAELFSQAGIINVTPNSLVNAIKMMSSDEIYKSIGSSMDAFVSLCISSKYKSSIFDAKIINEESQVRLENLLLNFKKDIILKK